MGEDTKNTVYTSYICDIAHPDVILLIHMWQCSCICDMPRRLGVSDGIEYYLLQLESRHACHGTHRNESCHIGVMSLIWMWQNTSCSIMCHCTHVTESWHSYEWVTSRRSHVPHMNVRLPRAVWVMSLIKKESCDSDEWIVSHKWAKMCV